MKLFELMSLGDDNAFGRYLDDARKSLKKLQQNSDSEVRSLATGLLDSLDSLEANVNILQTDGYTVMNYLSMLSKPSVGKQTLRMISDMLGSYDDSEGD